MTDRTAFTAAPWGESGGHCDCCGKASKTIWGGLSDADGARAAYFVQWTIDEPDHFPNIDLVIGNWGDGTNIDDRVLVSLLYRPQVGSGTLMIVDGNERLERHAKSCSRALRRNDVIGTPHAAEVFALVDAVWLTDPRTMQMRALDDIAPARE